MNRQFTVEYELLKKANGGNAAAQYQIGLQAFSEGRLGFAKIYFSLAHHNRYPNAWRYYLMASNETMKKVASL